MGLHMRHLMYMVISYSPFWVKYPASYFWGDSFFQGVNTVWLHMLKLVSVFL